MTRDQMAALRARAERGQDTAVLSLMDENARLREALAEAREHMLEASVVMICAVALYGEPEIPDEMLDKARAKVSEITPDPGTTMDRINAALEPHA